jgi:hypothetical protein
MDRIRPTYANVAATLALFVALSGTAYAAVKLPANSVGTKQLKNKAVTPAKVAPKTIARFKGQRGPQGPSNAYFDSSTPTAFVTVPAGDYAVYGHAVLANNGTTAVSDNCFLQVNDRDLSTSIGSGEVTIPAGGSEDAFAEGVAHLDTSGRIRIACVAHALMSNAITAIKIETASSAALQRHQFHHTWQRAG